jgi:hypothetical protein
MKLVIYDVIKVDHEKNINTDVKIDRLRIKSIVSVKISIILVKNF